MLFPVCGNDACEIGESCLNTNCTTGCLVDCGLWGVTLKCPTPDVTQGFPALPCAGRGVCEPRTGFCNCFAGYVGDDCTQCDEFYEIHVAQGLSSCVRVPPPSCEVRA